MRTSWTVLRRRTWALVFPVVVVIAAPGEAQRGGIVLSVAVRDAHTGEPVIGAEVTVRDANLKARTDSLGRVLFPGVPLASGSIGVRRLGYAPLETSFRSTGDTLRILLQLEPVAQALPRASVVDTEGLSRLPEFESRHGKRFGWFITEKEIRAAMGSRLSDLIRTKIPGLRIRDNPDGSWVPYSTRGPRDIHGGLCTPLIFFDGVQTSAEFDLAPLSLLAGVEYYPPGFVPVQYKALAPAPTSKSGGGGSAACGVLLLWTIH